MSDHKSQEYLENEINEAKKSITVGEIYQHYKSSDMKYRVLNIAITEETEETCVVYQALYGKEITFVRPVKVWLEKVEFNDKIVPRFKKL